MAYENRLPHKKPFFYPGVLMPRVARALVNISKVKDNEVLFDPFCGTAGILVEGAIVGAKVIGIEVRSMIASGAQMNLQSFGGNYNVIVGDACTVPLKGESVDSIVTDPPYGRSAAIRAESLYHLYAGSFREMHRLLRKGKIAIVVSEIEAEFAKDAGGFFEIIGLFLQKALKPPHAVLRYFYLLYLIHQLLICYLYSLYFHISYQQFFHIVLLLISYFYIQLLQTFYTHLEEIFFQLLQMKQEVCLKLSLFIKSLSTQNPTTSYLLSFVK